MRPAVRTCCRPFAVHLEAQQADANKVGHLSEDEKRIMILDGAPEHQERLARCGERASCIATPKSGVKGAISYSISPDHINTST
jgi:hypothetical protein